MIYLHIGRNKAGSTTLQDFCIERHRELLASGVRYVHFGHLADSHPDIKGFASAPELAAWVRSSGETAFVSNEFMSAWDDVYTQAVGEALGGLDVQVLFYVRDYCEWLPSLYAESVKRGEETADFDAFAGLIAPRVSVRPMLTAWAAAVGWSRIRVRALDPISLDGGDIVTDLLCSLDLTADLATGWIGRSNRSPGWIGLELIREARRMLSDEDWSTNAAAVQRLAEMMPPSPSPADAAAGYLTSDQVEKLADLYDDDARWILDQTGTALPRARRGEGRGRLAPPSWLDAPVSAIARLRQAQPSALADRLIDRVQHCA